MSLQEALASPFYMAVFTALFTWWIRRRLLHQQQQRPPMLSSTHSVGIIGAGLGGIITAKRCLDLGIPFHIYELAEDFGGTWLKNTYPGCGCDIPSHAYSFSWAPNPEWSRKWAKQPELLAYFHDVAKNQLQLHQHASFYTRVISASFGRDGRWTLQVQDVRTGEVSLKDHQFVMSAVGQLNVPLIPSNLDASKFEGTHGAFHSAQWPRSALDLTGKRVAVIGTGASAIQLVPELAKQCSEVHVFQRSKVHLFDKPDYAYYWWVKLMFRAFPVTMLVYRAYIFSVLELIFYSLIPNVKGSASNKYLGKMSTDFMTSQLEGDLAAQLKVVPQPGELLAGCKRVLLTSEWCKLFNGASSSASPCTLHTAAVTEITATGVRSATGEEVEVDCVVFGTGFATGSFLHGLRVEAWDDQQQRMVSLHDDVWGGAKGATTAGEAYRGVTVKQMPNLAMCYAANSNLNHSSICSIIEAQVEHFVQLVERTVNTKNKQQFCVKTRAHDAFNVREQELLKDTVFSADCESWYKSNAMGRIVNNFHGGLLEFWWSTSRIRWEDYDIN